MFTLFVNRSEIFFSPVSAVFTSFEFHSSRKMQIGACNHHQLHDHHSYRCDSCDDRNVPTANSSVSGFYREIFPVSIRLNRQVQTNSYLLFSIRARRPCACFILHIHLAALRRHHRHQRTQSILIKAPHHHCRHQQRQERPLQRRRHLKRQQSQLVGANAKQNGHRGMHQRHHMSKPMFLGRWKVGVAMTLYRCGQHYGHFNTNNLVSSSTHCTAPSSWQLIIAWLRRICQKKNNKKMQKNLSDRKKSVDPKPLTECKTKQTNERREKRSTQT